MSAAGPRLTHNSIRLATGTAVIDDAWSRVTTPWSYDPGEMVVVATPGYTGDQPVVVRIRNATDNGFEIRAEVPGGAFLAQPVHATWVTIASGVYNLGNGALRIEARRMQSTTVDRTGSWNGELFVPTQSYAKPIVLGQVMTDNDDWSVFWARGAAPSSPPTASAIYVGRHVGDDPDQTRSPEELGVIVMDEAVAEINGLCISASRTLATGRNFPVAVRTTPNGLATSFVASAAGMFGPDGAWPTSVAGSPEFTDGAVRLRLEEDQLGDSEREHNAENVAVLAIDGTHDAIRFCIQAGFGGDLDHARSVAAAGHHNWLASQATEAPSQTLPWMVSLNAIEQPFGKALDAGDQTAQNAIRNSFPFLFTFADQGAPDALNFSTIWLRNLLAGDDQLRQRVAWSLSQIFVVSGRGSQLRDAGASLADFYDRLSANALGSFRDLLGEVSVHPAMAYYLSSLGNQPPDPATNRQPDENYAREVMQLFTIGLWELNNDGSRKLDDDGEPIPTYGNADITNIARVFTGLWYEGRPFGTETNVRKNQGATRRPLAMFEEQHDTGPKRAFVGKPWELNLPGAAPGQSEIDTVLDTLVNHPNTPPFIARRLIQFLVTSNPKPAYIERVANTFIDNGQGVRGDLHATVMAVLLDREARGWFPDDPTRGKLLEPMVRLAVMARTLQAGQDPGIPVDTDDQYFWRFKSQIDAFAQWPLQSPSVFNFFEPDYSHAGPIRDQDLFSPEMQIHTPVTAVTFPNELANMIDIKMHPHRPELTPEFRLYTAALHPFVYGNGSLLIDRLDTLFCWGTMSTGTRDLIAASIAAFPVSGDFTPGNVVRRAKLATWLTMVSPDAAVMR